MNDNFMGCLKEFQFIGKFKIEKFVIYYTHI